MARLPKDVINALRTIANHCMMEDCDQCPLKNPGGENFENCQHLCDLRNVSPDEWRYLIDPLLNEGEQ